MLVPGYTTDGELHRGRKRVVFRARRDRDGARVIIKSLAAEFPTVADTASLRREFEILQSLTIQGIARAQALESVRDRLALILEDHGGETLKQLIAQGPMDLGRFLELALALAGTLAELHRHNLIHKDINPNNILVNSKTGAVTLLDFGISSRVRSEQQSLQQPHLLEGTIAYMSPEQTGRMNRDLDYRSDFYSLGITFYEMLTGHLPFDSPDPLEVIHCHIAQVPAPPVERAPGLPLPVSDIVMKLLAKAPEDRYQSGHGLKADLTRCAEEWRLGGRITNAPLGQKDVPDRFVIPQRLYGRESEVVMLRQSFDRASAGRTELMLVSGYSGIGKTSLIHEIYKSLPRRRGRFIAGKFDQLARDVPYGALVQAFQGLVRQVLGETDRQIRDCADRLATALGANARVMIDVIPELERILGPQPSVPALDATEAQIRFNLVFQKFVGVFARSENPLVLFLDDLQWADAATLSLLPLFLSDPEITGLLLIGAYRDNEVSETHPLRLAVTDILARKVPIQEIRLPPLDAEHLRQFIGDTLRTGPEGAAPVTDLVLGKTGGNPFFVTQFLQTLHQDGLIRLDHAAGEWRVDLDATRRVAITDNVADLMSGRIQRLAPGTQQVLRLAACVGNRFDLQTLATISELGAAEVGRDLWEAVEQGLVLPLEKSYGFAPDLGAGLDPAAVAYRFLHDRVQQAAYAMIPEEARRQVHLTVGRLLLAHGGGTVESDTLFDVVNHLNFGSGLITDPGEQIRLAELNLVAGRKAKASAAFPSALGYFAAGTALLSDEAWREQHPLAFGLHAERAETEYLCGRFAEAEAGFGSLLARCRSPEERTDVYVLLIVLFETMARYSDAIRAGLEGLRPLGVDLPEDPAAQQPALDEEVEAVRRAMGDRVVGSLLELPSLEDPRIRQALRLLRSIWAPSFISCSGALCGLVVARMVRLSLENGNSEDSAFGYLHHAITVGSLLGEYQLGHQYGELALALNERLADLRLRAVIHHRFAALVNPWCRSFATCFTHARDAVRAGLESGNLQVAGYAQFQQSWYGMLVEADLAGFHKKYAPVADFLAQLQTPAFLGTQRLILQWGLALEGRTEGPTSFNATGFDETAFLQTFGKVGIFRGMYATMKVELLHTFGQVEEARVLAAQEEPAVELFFGSIWPAMFAFRHVLVLCAWLPGAPVAEREAAEKKLDQIAARLRTWADNAPENFRHMYLLASAEIARVRDQAGEAVTRYEEALEAAAALESPRHRALANELYGRFWLDRRQPRIAAVFLGEARYGYAQWGATAKVADLDRRYAALLRRAPADGAPREAPTAVLQTTETVGGALDAVAVARAAQAISREIELDKLLERLLRVALESAGAERGALLLEREGEAEVHVEGSTGSIHVRTDRATPASVAELPLSLVNYVRRCAESLVLSDACHDEQYGNDPYIVRERPRSILCTPVLNQGKLVGVLYMENRLTAEAFTPDRVQLMQILSSQAAIAIQNAQLFAEVTQLRDRLQAENVYLVEEMKSQHGFEEIVGTSSALKKVLAKVEQVAPTETTVLITGETGTGKELVARAIHTLSPRRERTMVSVNCGAISPGLVESELFGHEKGAFTGAISRKIGRFELADGGTVFLDEIGDLPLDLQVKLLRVLQEGEFERVGGTTSMKVNVRVIAATHQDLHAAVTEGRFRADLFYRLNVFPIRTPALRERKEDIPPLVRHFVLKYASRLGRQIETIPKPTLDALSAYPWPGNIRELGNIIERSVILSRGRTLELGDWITTNRETGAGSNTGITLEAVERHHILQILEECSWKVSGAYGAAARLGLKPTTLESRMKKLGITRPA